MTWRRSRGDTSGCVAVASRTDKKAPPAVERRRRGTREKGTAMSVQKRRAKAIKRRQWVAEKCDQSTAVDGQVVECGATAEFCKCAKPAGHVVAGDPVHGCAPTVCTAQWEGDYGSDEWRPVQMPMPVQPVGVEA